MVEPQINIQQFRFKVLSKFEKSDAFKGQMHYKVFNCKLSQAFKIGPANTFSCPAFTSTAPAKKNSGIKFFVIHVEHYTWCLLSGRSNLHSFRPLKFEEIKKAIFGIWRIYQVPDKQRIVEMFGCNFQWVQNVNKDLDQAE